MTFKKRTRNGVNVFEELQATFKKEREALRVKARKLKEMYDAGELPDTPFFDSFIPRVHNKLEGDVFPLSDAEKSKLNELYDQY